eukprot:gene17989-24402_t
MKGDDIVDSVEEVVPYKQYTVQNDEGGMTLDSVEEVVPYKQYTVQNDEGGMTLDSVEEVVPYKQYTVQEIDLLARSAGLKVEELYGEMALDVGMTHEDAYRMIIVLSKPNK